MDSWVVQQVTFWFTVYEIKPGAIVDKVIQFYLDIVTPGRGTGESHWWMRQMRTLEQSGERAHRELEIRRDLRAWDNEHPQIHHELIVRYVVGAAVSVAVTSFYNSLIRRGSGNGYSRRY